MLHCIALNLAVCCICPLFAASEYKTVSCLQDLVCRASEKIRSDTLPRVLDFEASVPAVGADF